MSPQYDDTIEESRLYQNSAERAEENRSFGWVLLLMGIVGILVVILGIMGMISFRPVSSYLTYGVMSAIFILFIIMGAISMKNAGIFAYEKVYEKVFTK
ncbi:MAG: hypothetical protein NC251_08915 [Lachnoclostridium sp.]|nr:hypothetical protein [Lachnospira sp.]MCM1248537.1 hypothetical protein [Lachnoclostridium sp.]MCM1536040.1 hypothetical protein [Clostridium sp.]